VTVELLASLNEAAKPSVGEWTRNIRVQFDRLHHALSMTLEGAIRRSVEDASGLQDQDALVGERICRTPRSDGGSRAPGVSGRGGCQAPRASDDAMDVRLAAR
jgi:hypothetical protein